VQTGGYGGTDEWQGQVLGAMVSARANWARGGELPLCAIVAWSRDRQGDMRSDAWVV
jgi:hypothetical protein